MHPSPSICWQNSVTPAITIIVLPPSPVVNLRKVVVFVHFARKLYLPVLSPTNDWILHQNGRKWSVQGIFPVLTGVPTSRTPKEAWRNCPGADMAEGIRVRLLEVRSRNGTVSTRFRCSYRTFFSRRCFESSALSIGRQLAAFRRSGASLLASEFTARDMPSLQGSRQRQMAVFQCSKT